MLPRWRSNVQRPQEAVHSSPVLSERYCEHTQMDVWTGLRSAACMNVFIYIHKKNAHKMSTLISEFIFVFSYTYFILNYTCSKWQPDYNCSYWKPVYNSQICGVPKVSHSTFNSEWVNKIPSISLCLVFAYEVHLVWMIICHSIWYLILLQLEWI